MTKRQTTIKAMYGRKAVFRILTPGDGPSFDVPLTEITGYISRCIETRDSEDSLIFEVDGLSISIPVPKEKPE
jgi:hypothetical protein